MTARLLELLILKPNQSAHLVEKSYDRISSCYDQAWTNHMRNLSEQLIAELSIKQGDKALDLTCGTGFVTNLLSQKTATQVLGVDRSQGMLKQAHKKYGGNCKFIKSDILEFLKNTPAKSFDIVTCCWGLGYSKPFAVLRQVKRILKPKGKVAIIDNNLFSLAGVLYCSFLTFMEQPDKLANLMRFRFLTGKHHLSLWFRVLGFKPLCCRNGKKSYNAKNGTEAIDKLRATGAAAGFEYAANQEEEKEIFERFAEIIENKYMKENTIRITHRYLAGIAQK